MYTRRLIRLVLASGLLFTLVTTAQMASGGNRVNATGAEEAKFISGREDRNGEDNEPVQQGSTPESSVIIVNGRTLTGPNSAAQQRGGRLYLPVASIARVLGDVIQSDAASRLV